jgi:hypothetical protein
MYVICVCLRILSCVSVCLSSSSVLCTIGCQFLRIVHFFIAFSVFYDVYLAYKNDPHINTHSR